MKKVAKAQGAFAFVAAFHEGMMLLAVVVVPEARYEICIRTVDNIHIGVAFERGCSSGSGLPKAANCTFIFCLPRWSHSHIKQQLSQAVQAVRRPLNSSADRPSRFLNMRTVHTCVARTHMEKCGDRSWEPASRL